MTEKSDLRERARKAIDNLKGMSGSMVRIQYENGKGPAKVMEDLLQALDAAERGLCLRHGEQVFTCPECVAEEERERCAKLIEDMAYCGVNNCGLRLAKAIRREGGKG